MTETELQHHHDKNIILLVGEHRKLILFDTNSNKWHFSRFSSHSNYQGMLKYTSVCSMGERFVMTGGCSVSNLEPVRNTYVFTLQNYNLFKSYKPLTICRYGHSSIVLNGWIYVLGGFDHRDDEMSSPNTLNSCECINYNGGSKW